MMTLGALRLNWGYQFLCWNTCILKVLNCPELRLLYFRGCLHPIMNWPFYLFQIFFIFFENIWSCNFVLIVLYVWFWGFQYKNGSVTALIWGASPQTRSDRRKDRVETNPEQLAAASAQAEISLMLVIILVLSFQTL